MTPVPVKVVLPLTCSYFVNMLLSTREVCLLWCGSVDSGGRVSKLSLASDSVIGRLFLCPESKLFDL